MDLYCLCEISSLFGIFNVRHIVWCRVVCYVNWGSIPKYQWSRLLQYPLSQVCLALYLAVFCNGCLQFTSISEPSLLRRNKPCWPFQRLQVWIFALVKYIPFDSWHVLLNSIVDTVTAGCNSENAELATLKRNIWLLSALVDSQTVMCGFWVKGFNLLEMEPSPTQTFPPSFEYRNGLSWKRESIKTNGGHSQQPNFHCTALPCMRWLKPWLILSMAKPLQQF